VADRVAGQVAGAVQQAEVQPPGVDADRVDRAGLREPVADLGPEVAEVPAQPAAGLAGAVGEPVDLGQFDPRAVEAADEHPAALRTEVDGGDRTGVHRPGPAVRTSTPAARQPAMSSSPVPVSVIRLVIWSG
jgi:hypothetical protein